MSNQNETFIREQVRRILLEFDGDAAWAVDRFGAGPRLNVMKTLIMPFVDVFKVAFVAAKDITSAALDITHYALTFDGEKQKDIKERFRQRREKYKGQMKNAMKSTEEALNSPDAKMFTFLAAPQLVLAKAAGDLAWSASEPVRDKAEDFFGGSLGIGDRAISASTDADKSPGLMADLKRAFFGEGLDEIDEIELILIEQEKQKDFKPPTEDELAEMAAEYIKESGFDKQIDEAWDALIEDKQKEIDEVLESQRAKIEGLTALSMAETLEEAETAVGNLKTLDIDLSEPFTKVKEAIKQEAEKLKAGGPETEKIIAALRKSPEGKGLAKDAPPEEFFPMIEASLLGSTFSSVVEDSKNEGAGELLGFVAEMSPDDLKKLSSMSPRGKEYADMIFKFRDDLLRV